MGKLRFTSKIVILISLLFNFSIAYAVVPPPVQIRTVQCGAMPSQQEADMLKIRLTQLGYSPIWLQNDPDFIRVYVGKCENYPDAYILKESLINNGISGAFVRNLNNENKENFTSEFSTPDTPLVLPKSQELENKIIQDIKSINEVKISSIKNAIQSNNTSETISEGLKLISSLDDNDQSKGYALTMTSRNLIAKEKKSSAGLSYALKVAKKEVAATNEDIVKARFTLADSWHYYDFKPIQAYKAYKEILKEHGSDPSVKAKILVETCACMLELARSQKSDFPEVRRECLKAKESISQEYYRAHATIDLIYAETYIYAAEMDKAIELLTNFDKKYPQRKREISMSYLLLGSVYGQIGNWEQCKSYYGKILSMDFSDNKELFSWAGEPWDLKERALSWLVKYSEIYKDDAANQTYKSMKESGNLSLSMEIKNSNYSFATDFYFRPNE